MSRSRLVSSFATQESLSAEEVRVDLGWSSSTQPAAASVAAAASANAGPNTASPASHEGQAGPATNPTHCAVCKKPSARSDGLDIYKIRKLDPRLQRHIQRAHPTLALSSPDARDWGICTFDLHSVLRKRVEQLLEEDSASLAQLQDDAMRNLGQHEIEEEVWQRQFDTKRTFGQKAADAVARFGGSWGFVLALTGFLVTWAALNLILAQFGSSPNGLAWDPYPFILLNLFLSSLAAFQAPIIMMSQNRQSYLDRLESDYIHKIILRSENQTRHVNTKLDHLVNSQWRRLLEMQELQIALQDQYHGGSDMSAVLKMPTEGALPLDNRLSETINRAPKHLSFQTQPDDHTMLLLRIYYGLEKADDHFIFSHWHWDGDNFFGYIDNVKLNIDANKNRLRSITYDITFSEPNVTLDDLFSGEGSVNLRNDFALTHMNLTGRIASIIIATNEKVHSFSNGDLPNRYKPSFAVKRIDRITDLWKSPIKKVTIVYAPPNPMAVIEIPANQTLSYVDVTFFPPQSKSSARLYLDSYFRDMDSSLKILADERPLPVAWQKVASCEWPEEPSPVPSAISSGQEVRDPVAPIVMDVRVEIEGPRTVVLFCDDTHVTFHGHLSDRDQ
ncbi:uncharacterized protein BJ171DRAFT_627518 [Polychytrium aggregatum]|uniref:uncharacterized protein n=1 Tax=Polychytrium aggregatum TaxID=110093 RepID=UPI0022FEE14E|nr:uncharacterized protein BJ171DRAFT_627518 [Polychytrium aggregatum]KAI9202591.1 hypothetical protein BJ171DRAFT_627518 [Polychytrium aggregatum]